MGRPKDGKREGSTRAARCQKNSFTKEGNVAMALRSGGGGDGKRLHYRISRASAAAAGRPTFDDSHQPARECRNPIQSRPDITPHHPVSPSFPSPSHDFSLDAAGMPFERAQSALLLPRPSPKSPLIYIIAKTEKKRRPCPSDPRSVAVSREKDEKGGTCVKHAFSRLPSFSLPFRATKERTNGDFC